MKQKINLRLIGIAVIAVLATAIGITFIYYGLFKKQVQAGLRTNAEVLMETGVFEKSSQYADVKLPINNLRVTWIDSDGVVLFDNDNDINVMPNHKDRPEIQDAFHTGHGQCVRNSDTMDMNTFYYALKQKDGTVIRVSCDASSLLSVFGNVFPAVTGILAVIIVVCIVLSQLLTRTLIEPIERMAKNMDSVQEKPVYKEIAPFAEKIRTQHENILAAARSRQDFTANVSHELKTPLTAISGYAELIENEMVNHEQGIHFAHEIKRNSERLLSLINDIIRLSELDDSDLKLEFETVDLHDLGEQCIHSMQMQADKNEVTLHLEGASVPMNGNKTLLEELLFNLCSNAVRYNKKGGSVTIVTTIENTRPVLIVKDTGIGIPKEQQERVFERFYRVDKSRSKSTGGTGLGLAIVKHIVAQHDAQMTLTSEVGVGTEIKIVF